MTGCIAGSPNAQRIAIKNYVNLRTILPRCCWTIGSYAMSMKKLATAVRVLRDMPRLRRGASIPAVADLTGISEHEAQEMNSNHRLENRGRNIQNLERARWCLLERRTYIEWIVTVLLGSETSVGGRAPRWQRGGQGFKSPILHHDKSL